MACVPKARVKGDPAGYEPHKTKEQHYQVKIAGADDEVNPDRTQHDEDE
jgi:hypothetical protein